LGREILESDEAAAPKICVINEAFAKRFFDGRNPIGMRITSVGDNRRTTYQVVGVAKNARTRRLRGDVEPRYFVPAGQSSANHPVFLIRTATDAAPLMAAVRKSIQLVETGLPMVSIRSIEEQIEIGRASCRERGEIMV